MGLEDTNSQPAKDNLSSVSTILGLALFCLLIATILVRRVMVHRQSRRFAQHRLLAAASVIGRGGGTRNGDSIDDDEPRTIALGARAALLKRPVIWEEYIACPNPHFTMEKQTGGSCWDHLQPAALQLLTPHTTAHFPKAAISRGGGRFNSQRMGRAYAHFLFHRDHAAGTSGSSGLPPVNTTNQNVTPNGSPAGVTERRSESSTQLRRLSAGRSQRSVSETRGVENPQSEEKNEDESAKENLYSHPVHLTFLICMPDASTPTYAPSRTPPTLSIDAVDASNPRLPSWISRTQQPPKNTVLTPLCLGTADPTALLPSLLIPHSSLDSWWNLPTSPTSPSHFGINTTGLSAGQILQLENARIQRLGEERILAERAAREREEDRIRERERERAFREGVGARPSLVQFQSGSGSGGSGVYEGYSGLVHAVRGYGPGISRG